jgi:hypothetical protein
MQTILGPQTLAGTGLQDLMREMLVRLGEDPERDGLWDTPERMERSMHYLTKGYQEDPEEILLGAMFDVAYDEMVIVKDIEMFSLCEHRTPPSPVLRQGPHRVHPEWKSDWTEQSSSPGGRLCASIAGAGTTHNANR